MMKPTKQPQTCRQVLEAEGVKVFPTVDGEFVAYKPIDAQRGTNIGFNLARLLEELSFYDYEEIACGRAYHVMGYVGEPV